jgi:predicted RNase H-like HicB family nuclease
MAFKIEIDREEDGRWITEIPSLPGVIAYGKTRNEAIAKVQALAFRVLADRLERRKMPAKPATVTFAIA